MLQLRATIEKLLETAQYDSLMESCKSALAEARKNGDRPSEILALIGLAQAQKFAGKFHEARVLVDGALQYATQIQDEELLVLAWLSSASIYITGNFQTYEAERDYRLALNLGHDLADDVLVTEALMGLATVYLQLGENYRAGRYAREAVSSAQRSGYRYGMAMALSLAGAAAAPHQAEKALQAYEDALAIAKQEDYRSIEMALTGSIGQLLSDEHRYQIEALQMMEKAVENAKEIRSVPHEFAALARLGRSFEKQGALERAAETYGTMLEKAQEWRARAYEGMAFFNLGILAFNRKHYDDAIANFQQALGLARETKNPFQEAQIEQALGASYEALHNWDMALSHYMASRSLYEALDSHALANQLMQMIFMTYLNRFWARLLNFLGLRGDKDAE